MTRRPPREGRRFTRNQRAALFLAADGKCEECGTELPVSWHADHMTPWSRGGKTHMSNGQALCPPCNLRKGNRMTELAGMRPWQINAINRYLAENPTDWTVAATPGAGKTRFALTLAQMLLDQGTVERVVVVVPSDTLREQWADNKTIPLFPVRQGEGAERDKPGYKGGVFTYQSLASGSAVADLQARACRKPTLVIFDEIHHAGDGRSWCEALERAFGGATRRLMLTGTPWRRDDSRIPFVEYRYNRGNASVEVKVDFAYTYGEAVRDEACRAIEFHAYTGDAKWADCGKVITASLNPELNDEDLSTTLDILFDPDKPWISTMLERVARALDETRETVPNAGGLVIAENQYLARRYAELLARCTGTQPTLVISDDLEANEKLAGYRDCPQCKSEEADPALCRHSRPKWLVAVRKVSEGVDIPRLAVGLYAAKVRTPLFFQQVVGRFVRRGPADEHNAMLFIPAVPVLMAHAREIELMLRHEVEIAREELERAKREFVGRQLALDVDLLTPLDTSEAVFDRAIFRNQDYTLDDLSDVLDDMRSAGIPEVYAVSVASILSKRQALRPTMTAVHERPIPQQIAEPRHKLERRLRGEIESLSRKIASATGRENKVVNGELRKRFGVSRRDAPVEVLEEIHDYCVKWLGDL